MEPVIYENIKNGKRGILLEKNRFNQFILEVEGKNVAYNGSTIKRWWKIVDEKVNTEETTSASEKPKAEEPEQETHPKKEISNNSSDINTNQAKGPDVEVFSYIEKKAAQYNFSIIRKQYLSDRDIHLVKKNSKGKERICFHFYVGNNIVRVNVRDKDKTLEITKKLKVTDTINATTFRMSTEKFKDGIDELLKLF